MREYFEESIHKGVTLKITTKKSKTMLVIVKEYSIDKLYYIFKKNNQLSQISIVNIDRVEFEKQEDEISFRMKKLGLSSAIKKYLLYYKNCIEMLESKSNFNFKETMFHI